MWAIVECAIEDLRVSVKKSSSVYDEQIECRNDAIDFLENNNWVATAVGVDPAWINRVLKNMGLL